MLHRALMLVAVLAITGIVTACSAPKQHDHHRHAVRTFSFSDGVTACNDVAAWYPAASNATGNSEQFSPSLLSDMAKAGNSQLGQALQTMYGDDQPGNYTWWMTGPGTPSDYQNVRAICANSYGVTLPSSGS